jgi:ribosomal protein L22
MSPERDKQAAAHGGDQADVAADAAMKDAAEAVAQQEAADAAPEETPKPKRKPAAKKPAAKKPAAKKAADTEAEAKPAEKKAPAKKKPAAKKTEEKAAPAKPAKPAAAPKRSRRGETTGAPVVRAQAKYVRTSARKARLVCDHIRGKSVEDARAILAMTSRQVASDWTKLLESAIANAENNHELVGDDLRIKDVYADEGPTLKRFRPRAMGRATKIRKRTSHLTITLTPKE